MLAHLDRFLEHNNVRILPGRAGWRTAFITKGINNEWRSFGLYPRDHKIIWDFSRAFHKMPEERLEFYSRAKDSKTGVDLD